MVSPFYSPLKISLYDVETWGIIALDKGSTFHIGKEGARDCFLYNKGLLLVKFPEPGMMINADSYCDTLLRLHQAI